MEGLPQEIIDEIGAFFSPDQVKDSRKQGTNAISQRPALASLSQAWQLAIERQTFTTITLASTELDRFNEILTGHRRHMLKVIKYQVVLPSYSDVSCGRFEREPDRDRNNKAFTEALAGLFRVLASWDADSQGAASSFAIELQIENIYSPMDSDHRTAPVVIGRPGDLLSTRFKYSYLMIQHPYEPPAVPSITTLRTMNMKRKLAPEAVIHIARKLPNLRVADFYLFDDERRYHELRRQHRDAFGRALNGLALPQTLQEFNLKLGHAKQMSHLWQPPVLLSSDSRLDPVGKGIHTATQVLPTLRKLKVEGVVDWALLWPEHLDYTTGPLTSSLVPPFWQSLEDLEIRFALTTPSGDYYFVGKTTRPPPQRDNEQLPPGYGFTEEQDLSAAFQYDYSTDQLMSGLAHSSPYRSVPQADKLQPLVTSFALACAQIPTLKTASLSTEIWNGGIDVEERRQKGWIPWGVWYAAPGAHFRRDFEQNPRYCLDTLRRKLVLDIGDWHPDPRSLELLRSIGQKQHTRDMAEWFLDDKT